MKTAIKSFEIIKKMYKYFVKKYRDLEPKLMICEKEDFDNVEKHLKALEIIKEKKVDVDLLKISDDLEDYHFMCYMCYKNILTQKEYDLLKETLSCSTKN